MGVRERTALSPCDCPARGPGLSSLLPSLCCEPCIIPSPHCASLVSASSPHTTHCSLSMALGPSTGSFHSPESSPELASSQHLTWVSHLLPRRPCSSRQVPSFSSPSQKLENTCGFFPSSHFQITSKPTDCRELPVLPTLL